jgi:BlaI family penicillinase repressor
LQRRARTVSPPNQSHRQQQSGADHEVVGRAVTLHSVIQSDAKSYTVIGIVSEAFQFPFADSPWPLGSRCRPAAVADGGSLRVNTMVKSLHSVLSRRERQIMDILFRLGRATAAEVMEELPGNTSYSTVSTQLRVLEEKGHVRHEEEGLRYVYVAAVPRHAARKSALRHLVETFFDGSAEKTVAALLGGEGSRLTDEELERIAHLIAKTRKDTPGGSK